MVRTHLLYWQYDGKRCCVLLEERMAQWIVHQPRFHERHKFPRPRLCIQMLKWRAESFKDRERIEYLRTTKRQTEMRGST